MTAAYGDRVDKRTVILGDRSPAAFGELAALASYRGPCPRGSLRDRPAAFGELAALA